MCLTGRTLAEHAQDLRFGSQNCKQTNNKQNPKNLFALQKQAIDRKVFARQILTKDFYLEYVKTTYYRVRK